MPSRFFTRVQFVLSSGTLLCIALPPPMAMAALGGPEAAIATEAQQLKVSDKTTAHPNYRVHEIQLPSGTLLREFADTEGTVFAVAWSGPAIPNLRQALGQYFDDYANATRANHSGHSHFELRQDALVVQSGGRMRDFRGRAYLPLALPAGASLDEIH